MRYTRLRTESDDYLKAREELRLAELELMEHRERVAAMRRALPADTAVDDYDFIDATDEDNAVRLSELFTAADRSLIVYHLMYGKAQTEPCPMCTMWLDGFDATVHHVADNADLVVAAAAEPDALRAHAADRGWTNLRLLSCGDNTFKFDLGSEDSEGNQHSTISVFALADGGSPRHLYTAKPQMAEDIWQRGLDILSPVWNLLDLTPQGRDDWYAALSYDD